MRLNNKRPAEDELQPSRTRKRQAALPTTRITRSMRKINENNGISVHLHTGLSVAPRQRNKPTSSAPTQRECTPVQACGQAANNVEPVIVPAAICSSAPDEAPARQLSVTQAMSITAESQEVSVPVCAESPCRANLRIEIIAMNATEAANPGGPAPIADMGSNIPMMNTSCHTDIAPQNADIWGQSTKRQLRTPSNSSQISPRSGPAQACSAPTPSHADAMDLERDAGFDEIERTPQETTDIMLASSILHPAWVEVRRADFKLAILNAANSVKSIKEADGDMCKATQTEVKSAVLSAAYLVNSIKEARELLANEMYARNVEDNQELPVSEIFSHESAPKVSQDDTHFSPISRELSPIVVECDTNGSSSDNCECTVCDEPTEVRDLRCNTALSDQATTIEDTKACCPSNPAEAFCRSNAPSPSTTRGSIAACAIEQNLPDTSSLLEPSTTTVASHTAAGMPCLPNPPQKTAQQIKNLKREKELRAKLIEIRKTKKMTRQPCVQNVLVRTSDGSLSIITAQDSSVTICDLEDDQYSVEEYEEDTVSY